MLEGVVEEEYLALGPAARRRVATPNAAIALGHHEPEVRTQPPIGWPAVRSESRAWPQQ